ncbi:MAG: dienelactone hydrolase family protein [Pseudomonadota bacterium]
MCDENTKRDEDAYLKDAGLTRRVFTAGASAALGATTFPGTVLAASKYAAEDLREAAVKIATPDGEVDALFVHPEKGAHAAVIFWPDIHGFRPGHTQMAHMLAAHGYAVLAANPYYRTHTGQLFSDDMRFGDPGAWELVEPHYSAFSSQTVVTDAKAIAAWLDDQKPVNTARGIGAVGFCMTGSWTLRAAAAVPDRIKAPCSFHGGGLVTDKADSPHRLAPKITGGALIAIAENDHNREPGAKDVLIKAFEMADVPAEIEVYADALHGWVPIDSRVYNAQQSQRAWSRMLALFDAQLGSSA